MDEPKPCDKPILYAVKRNNNNNTNKVQTKTATPLHHIFFLFLYKGVETNSATPSLFCDPPPKNNQTTSTLLLLLLVVLVLLLLV